MAYFGTIVAHKNSSSANKEWVKEQNRLRLEFNKAEKRLHNASLAFSEAHEAVTVNAMREPKK